MYIYVILITIRMKSTIDSRENLLYNNLFGMRKMASTKDDRKLKETKFVIFIPFFITAICAWFDILFTKCESLLLIFRCIYTYFFPSIAGLMITLIIQKAFYNQEAYGIAENRIFLSSISLVVYCVIFLSCLQNYNFGTALFFGVSSLLYIIIVVVFCLDKNIIHPIDPVKEERDAYKKILRK